MEEKIHQWIQHISVAANKNLESVILYGSATDSVPGEKAANLNLLVVLKKIELADLTAITQSSQKYLKPFHPELVFWTAGEIKRAWDVFPVELSDIAARHRCLHGKNPFAKGKADRKNLRYQLEFELRSKLLGLRSAWVSLHRDAHALRLYLAQAIKSINHLLEKSKALFPKVNALPQELLETFTARKKHNQQELGAVYQRLHDRLAEAVSRIDAA